MYLFNIYFLFRIKNAVFHTNKSDIIFQTISISNAKTGILNTASRLILYGECYVMENKKANHNIACTVKQCKHHYGEADFCALNQIQIGTHEANPTMTECTDCESFALNNDCKGCHIG